MLGRPELATNEGRRATKRELHASIGEITREHTTAAVAEALAAAQIPHAPITPIGDVPGLEFVRTAELHTRAPDGRRIRLPPPAVTTPWLEARGREVPFPPAYGEHTEALLAELGLPEEERRALRARGVVA